MPRLFPALGLIPALGAAGAVLVLAACASSAAPSPGSAGSAGSSVAAPSAPAAISAVQLRNYVTAVEAVRLPVNQLLNQADPILDAYHDRRITPPVASARMGAMEQEFGGLAVEMGTIAPSNPTLARINAPYAHTYVLEDTYLAALASGLTDGNLGDLPNTQNAQRQAIVAWRIALEVAAARVGLTLPADIQQAGRGEIAPGLDGS